MENNLHKLGQEKIKIFQSDFDKLYDWYKLKAEKAGYFGELKFIKERGKIIIYVEIKLPDIEEENNKEDE
jgi:hypothetical protein